MELVRALGVLCEPPTPAHAEISIALELPGEPNDEDWAEVFLMQLCPYASVYLGAEGKLGGEARDRVAGFWRALGLVPPAEPDHLAALLGLYAELAERHAPSGWRRALLQEHLLSWTTLYLGKLLAIAPPCYRRWAELLHEVLAAEAMVLGPLPQPPLAHREAPPLQPPTAIGGAKFLDQLLAPVRTGFVLTRDDLAGAAQELRLGLRVGERRYVLEALLAQNAPATLRWLAAYADRSVRGHESGFWSDRAAAAAALLSGASQEAAEQEAAA